MSSSRLVLAPQPLRSSPNASAAYWIGVRALQPLRDRRFAMTREKFALTARVDRLEVDLDARFTQNLAHFGMRTIEVDARHRKAR